MLVRQLPITILLLIISKFFTPIAGKVFQKYSKPDKRFNDFLNFQIENPFFMSPTDLEEVQNPMNLIERHRAVGTSTIPTRILRVFKKPLSTY